MKFLNGAMLASVATAMAVLFPTAQAKVAGDTIIIGSAISLTGKHATNGIHTQNGYELATQKINEAGGVSVDGKQYKLNIRYYDAESSAALGVALAEQLILQDDIDYMLGASSSVLSQAIAQISEKHGVPMVQAADTSNALFNKGYEYLFSVPSTFGSYLTEAIDLAAAVAENESIALRDVKIGLAFAPDPLSAEVRQGVLDRIKTYGMRIVVDDKLTNLSDMTSTLNKVKALKPHVLLVSGQSEGAATVTRQMIEMGLKVPILAMTHCKSADLVAKYAEGANETLCATQWDESLPFSDKLFGTATDYSKLFKETYGSSEVVPYQSAQASAAVQALADAFERANSFDKDAVRNALSASDLSTFYSDIRFAATGHNMAKPMVMLQIKNGNFVVVAPAKWATQAADVSFK